jgi:hypothetical protein
MTGRRRFALRLNSVQVWISARTVLDAGATRYQTVAELVCWPSNGESLAGNAFIAWHGAPLKGRGENWAGCGTTQALTWRAQKNAQQIASTGPLLIHTKFFSGREGCVQCQTWDPVSATAVAATVVAPAVGSGVGSGMCRCGVIDSLFRDVTNHALRLLTI